MARAGALCGPSEAEKAANARRLAEDLVVAAIKLRSARDLAIGVGSGDRGPLGPARAAVELVEITEDDGRGFCERKTPVGYRTARVASPRLLAGLAPSDPARRAAQRYAALVEEIGAIRGAGFAPGGGGPRSGDGGAVRRIAMVRELRAMRAVLGGVALAPSRKPWPPGGERPVRRAIALREAVDAICLQGFEASAILSGHGWSPNGARVAALSEAVLRALREMDASGSGERGAGARK